MKRGAGSTGHSPTSKCRKVVYKFPAEGKNVLFGCSPEESNVQKLKFRIPDAVPCRNSMENDTKTELNILRTIGNPKGSRAGATKSIDKTDTIRANLAVLVGGGENLLRKPLKVWIRRCRENSYRYEAAKSRRGGPASGCIGPYIVWALHMDASVVMDRKANGPTKNFADRYLNKFRHCRELVKDKFQIVVICVQIKRFCTCHESMHAIWI